MPETTRKPLSWFKTPPQVRTDLGSETDLRNLGESLAERQLSPLIALADGELIAGFRRLAAATLKGMKDLDVTIYSELLTPSEIRAIRLSENFHRLDMSVYGKWRAIEDIRILNPQWSAKQLGEFVKIDPPALTKWLSPSKCIPAWQEALKAGQVGITDCYTAAQVSEDEQVQLLELKLGGATRDSLARAVRRRKTPQQEDSVRASRVSIPLASGSKVVVSGKNLSLSEIVNTLNECVAAARKAIKERLDAKTFQSVMRVQCSPPADEGAGNVQA